MYSKANHTLISKVSTDMSGLIISSVFQTGSHALKNRNIPGFRFLLQNLSYIVCVMRYALCRFQVVFQI